MILDIKEDTNDTAFLFSHFIFHLARFFYKDRCMMIG